MNPRAFRSLNFRISPGLSLCTHESGLSSYHVLCTNLVSPEHAVFSKMVKIVNTIGRSG